MKSNIVLNDVMNEENRFLSMVEDCLDIKVTDIGSNFNPYNSNKSNYTVRIPTKNEKLIGSSYFLNGIDKVLHFTSVKILFSIINEGAIRLYNLNNSNDEMEYNYAWDILKEINRFQNIQTKEWAEYVKTYSFIASLTNINEKYNTCLWERYADKKKGVAIEFEIVNEPEKWEYFYFAEIKYGEKNKFEKLKNNWQALIADKPNNRYNIELDQLIALHKSEEKKWRDENEVRILFLFPVKRSGVIKAYLSRDYTTDKYDKNIQYFSLPLVNNKNEYVIKNNDYINKLMKHDFFNHMPKLRIKNVDFGADFPIKGDEFLKFREYINYYISDKLKTKLERLPNTITHAQLNG
jgi:hypothetical protein